MAKYMAVSVNQNVKTNTIYTLSNLEQSSDIKSVVVTDLTFSKNVRLNTNRRTNERHYVLMVLG